MDYNEVVKKSIKPLDTFIELKDVSTADFA